MLKYILGLMLVMLACTNTDEGIKLNLKADKSAVTSGESLTITYDTHPEITRLKAALISENGRTIEVYNEQDALGVFQLEGFFQILILLIMVNIIS